MSYNNFPNNGLGMPSAGFASRGKGNGLKRLSVAAPPKINSISENHVDSTPTPPRTSRSHLLANLRTAPRTPAAPTSAPLSQPQYGMNAAQYGNQGNIGTGQGVPHTSIGTNFPNSSRQYTMAAGQQYYALPEVLAPPPVEMDESFEDPDTFARLQATKQYLALRQQMLQEQLRVLNLSAQMHGMNLGGQRPSTHGYPQTPVTPHMGMYNQQQQQPMNMQPIIQEAPGHPGLYLVINPLTGAYTYAVDESMQQEPQLANSPPPPTPSHSTNFNLGTPTFRAQVSPPAEAENSYTRSISPPKKTPSPPQDVTPLPPPSVNAFRRGHHKKISSLALNNTAVADGPKSAFVRPVGMPQTPTTGTFGPGQARAGEHPSRQPRGPPNIEELVAKPTTKHAGSKNFATRQRRQALHSLVRAGLERRVARPGSGSAGSMTPVSETELTFSVPSDNDSDSGRSVNGGASLSNKISIGSLRAVANGAIGSERKASKERLSSSSEPTSESDSADSKSSVGQRRKAPILALANAAEKRKGNVY
ncbi:hypothetical protein EJ06DRAFT_138832 [Trichodelitschia bisporula]|uniref:Uncharacterized protein n=1 Tax=Trichodelitschia bisporula TaxID=703511 RepID=A0A6G1HPK0_9PEZI|nr:hypothetical protein EJ06DRAFT_138832 [Trichodelitschia bisporula]